MERKFEAHVAHLEAPDVEDTLRKILDGRRLASVTVLDGIEHLVDPRPTLLALSCLLGEHRAVGVLSVPNVTHLDVATKALLGDWEYTDTGLLDRTHRTFYSAASLELALRETGLRRVDEHNVEIAHSDQHFPRDHVALAEATELGTWLRGLRQQAEPHARTNQFVWAVSAAPQRRRAECAVRGCSVPDGADAHPGTKNPGASRSDAVSGVAGVR